jgi:hypothetical protein
LTDIVAVEGSEAAGAIVYWQLSGSVDLQDLTDALGTLTVIGAPPSAPSMEVVLQRAAQQAVSSKRQMVRPLDKRGSYAFVEESVDGQSALKYNQRLTMRVEKAGLDQPPYAVVLAHDPEADEPLQAQVYANVNVFKGLLTASDVSSWLLHVMEQVHGVGLRDRGGIYFIPNDCLALWRPLIAALRTVSDHKVFEIPAMRTEEAVEAILTAVRRDAEAALAEMEAYLAGETSTKGLNAIDRRLEEVRVKAAHYAQLLGVQLPDLQAKIVTLTGAAQAARIVRDVAAEEE